MKRFTISAITYSWAFSVAALAWSQTTGGDTAATGTTAGARATGTAGAGAAATPGTTGIGAAGGITGQVQTGGGITGQGVPAGQQQPTGLDAQQLQGHRGLDAQQLQPPGVSEPGFRPEAAPGQPGLTPGQPRQPGIQQPGVQPEWGRRELGRGPAQRPRIPGTFPGPGAHTGPSPPPAGFPGGISPHPWFANPGARREIGMDDAQFNQLNNAWQQSWRRFLDHTRRANGADTLDPQQLDQQRLPQTLDPQQLDPQQLPQTQDPGQLHRQEPPRRTRLHEQQMRTLEGLSPAQRAQRLRELREGPRHAARFSPAERDLRTRAGIPPSDEQFQPLSPQEQEQRLREMRQAFHENFRQTLDTTLTDPQARTRYDQLALQAQGFAAFDLPAVRQRLNLSPLQQQQFNMLHREWNERIARLNQLGQVNPEAARQHFHALREQMNDRVATLLAGPQLQTWEQMIGEPFPFRFDDFHPPGLRHDPTFQIQQQRQLQQQQQLDAVFDRGVGIP